MSSLSGILGCLILEIISSIVKELTTNLAVQINQYLEFEYISKESFI